MKPFHIDLKASLGKFFPASRRRSIGSVRLFSKFPLLCGAVFLFFLHLQTLSALEGEIVILDSQEVYEGHRKIIYNKIATPNLLPWKSPTSFVKEQKRTNYPIEATGPSNPEYIFLDFFVSSPKNGWFPIDLWTPEGRIRFWSQIDFSNFRALAEITMGETIFILSVVGPWESPEDASRIPSKLLPLSETRDPTDVNQPQWIASHQISPRTAKLLAFLHQYHVEHGQLLAEESRILAEEESLAAQAAELDHQTRRNTDTLINYFPILQEPNP